MKPNATRVVSPKVGDVVIYCSPANQMFYALVIAVYWQAGYDLKKEIVQVPCVNIVIVSPNPANADAQGRQTEVVFNVIHYSGRRRDGAYWKWMTGYEF